jgi:hypothetical protein
MEDDPAREASTVDARIQVATRLAFPQQAMERVPRTLHEQGRAVDGINPPITTRASGRSISEADPTRQG